jgi:hypothetical protein
MPGFTLLFGSELAAVQIFDDQEFRSSGVQEFRSSGVQELQNWDLRRIQDV